MGVAASGTLGDLGLPPVTWTGLGLALVVLAVGLTLSRVVRRLVPAVLRWRGRSPGSADVFGRLVTWLLVLLALLAFVAVLFPSVRPVDVLGGIGVVSIAAGIAFQTVLGNMFAGIVILARDKYRVGDQIAVREHRGTVTQLGLTATQLRTFDGRLLLVPNVVLHSEVVTVQTGYEQVRTAVTLQLPVGADLDRAVRAALLALGRVPQAVAEPAPQALLSGVSDGAVTLELRFWSGARQLETREALHEVIRRVLQDLRREGVPVVDGTQVVEAGPALRGALGAVPDPSAPGTTP